MVQGSSATGEKYKPSGMSSLNPWSGQWFESIEHTALTQPPIAEHKGRREDNQPDRRTQQSQFAYGKVDPREAGHEGGKVGGHAGGVASGKGSAKQMEDEPEE
ncbi:hypothetical protein BDV19DRAFT_388121 [Aspergillus venezuelensis]